MAVLFILILGVLIYYVAKDEGGVEKDRQRFKSVEAKLSVLASSIEAKLGKPDAAESRNSCGRANLKSSKGPLTCSISHEYAYIVTNIDEADALASSVEEIMRNQGNKFMVIKPLKKSFKQIPGNISVPEIDSDYVASEEDMRCGLTYDYVPVGAFFGNLIADSSKENISISIGCGGAAKAEHYPMRD